MVRLGCFRVVRLWVVSELLEFGFIQVAELIVSVWLGYGCIQVAIIGQVVSY